MPAQTRALTTSSSASDRRAKLRVVALLLLNAVNGTRSVPKNAWSVCTKADVPHVCPEGWSGNGGVPSGACPNATGVGELNSGVHCVSGSVSALPSVSASWIAVIGRQKLQRYLLFQQPIA